MDHESQSNQELEDIRNGLSTIDIDEDEPDPTDSSNSDADESNSRTEDFSQSASIRLKTFLSSLQSSQTESSQTYSDEGDEPPIRGEDFLCPTCSSIPFSLFNKWTAEEPKICLQLCPISNMDASCPFCCFIFDSYQRFFLQYTDRVEDGDTTPSLILVSGQEPWYQIAGVSADLPNIAYAWLQFDLGSDYEITDNNNMYRPYICISNIDQDPVAAELTNRAFFLPRIKSEQESETGMPDMDLIRSWVSLCDKNHSSSCADRDIFKRRLLEVKLIDINTRQVVEDDGTLEYAALSYVWGQSEERPLPDGGYDISVGHLPTVLPKTVEDGIIFAQSLGLDYIWVDQYCINQEDSAEVKRQIQNMDLVFECASITIVALSGADIEQGLPGISNKLKFTYQPKVETRHGQFMATFIDSIWDSQGSRPWDLRAWTLQEGLLSNRCVFFDESHIFMRCHEEMFHNSTKLDSSKSRIATHQANVYFWDNGFSLNLRQRYWTFLNFDALIANYTGRNLTDQCDILDACRGALNQMTRNTGVGFIYGMPLLDLNKALLWKSWHGSCIKRREGFPSWSWAGWMKRTEFHYWLVEYDTYVDLIKDEYLKTQGHDIAYPKPEVLKLIRQDAFIHTKDVHESNNSHTLKISSTLAHFKIKLVQEAETLRERAPGSQQHTIAVGDHWTLLDQAENPLDNPIGEHTRFEATEYFFTVDPELSADLAQNGEQVQLVFIKYWPAIRDHFRSQSWLFDIVSALVVRFTHGRTAWRVAAVHLRLQDWLAAQPRPGVVELV